LHQLRLNFKSKSNNPKSKIELGAIHEAQDAIPLMPSAKDAMNGPGFEENLAITDVILGENRLAISNSLAALTNAVYCLLLLLNTHYARTFKTRSVLGPLARGSRFPETLPEKEAVN